MSTLLLDPSYGNFRNGGTGLLIGLFVEVPALFLGHIFHTGQLLALMVVFTIIFAAIGSEILQRLGWRLSAIFAVLLGFVVGATVPDLIYFLLI